VLFVCTANIGRSAYAEHRSAQLLAGGGDRWVHVSSAGVPGYPDRVMDAPMAAELRERGGNPDGHVSRALTGDILDEAHLVLTFEFAHRLRITESWPDQVPKVFAVRQLADAIPRVPSPGHGLELLDQALAVSQPDGLNWDVPDPHRRGAKAARACADMIDDALADILPGLAPALTGGAAKSLRLR
jgi:protein-tyrosine phosphatase